MESGCNCKGGEHKCCWMGFITKLLLVIGGLNWGLIAINPEWNVVTLAVGQWPQVERVVYGLVGLAALMMLGKMIMKCCGKKCCGGQCKK